MAATRDAGFGDEVKRRIILGTYALSRATTTPTTARRRRCAPSSPATSPPRSTRSTCWSSPTAPTTAFKLGEKLDDPLAMYLNDVATIPANLAGVPGMSLPVRPGRRGRAPVGFQILAPALADDRLYRVGAALEAPLARAWGGPLLDGAVARRCPLTHDRDTLVPYDDVARAVRPGPRARGARRAQHRDEDVLRLPDRVRRRAQHSGLPDLPRPARRAAGGQRDGRRVGDPDRSGAELQIAEWCRFARKNYFYPDMPKNFQTSQYDEPIAFDGYLDVEVATARPFRVEIERAHMEEDTGKSLHVGGATGRIHGADHSLVDYNRAGIPLIEIVTKPIEGTGRAPPRSPGRTSPHLRDLLRALGVSDVRMEQGSLRCDVNLSLRPARRTARTRTETKNVNSLRSVERAVRYEVGRHAAVLDAGGKVVQETRHFHEDTGVTTSGGRSPTPRTTATSPSPTWCRSRRHASGWRSCRRPCPSRPPAFAPGGRPTWGFTDLEMRDVVNAGAVVAHRGDGRCRCGPLGGAQVVAR